MLSWMFLFIMNDNRWYLQLKKMNWISIVYILLNLLLYLWKELVLVFMYQLPYTLANLLCKSCVPISILWWVTFIYLYTFYIYKSTMPKPHIGQTFKFHVHINISQKTISHKHEPYVVFLLTCMYFCLNISYLYTFHWFILVKIADAVSEKIIWSSLTNLNELYIIWEMEKEELGFLVSSSGTSLRANYKCMI